MDHVAIEDFQDYQNPYAFTDRADAQTLFHNKIMSSIEHDYPLDEADHDASLSGSPRHSSGRDSAVFDHVSTPSSPRTSHHSSESISDLPTSTRHHSYAQDPHFTSPYRSHDSRSAFRNPSSVRALQMSTTPPPYLTPSSQRRYKLSTPSRDGTPRSTHSLHSPRTSSRLSPTKQPKVKKEYPLILLHVTLLPLHLPYSDTLLETVLPSSTLTNLHLLREKLTPTVLSRGLLIPHPREDYDLLESRLLESLELKLPRILKCGHFHLSADEEAEIIAAAEDDGLDIEDGGVADADICEDCGRRIRDGRFGATGEGERRWDVKIYAANGMMRAGAWGAAWREMERVDIEIGVWIEEDLKRELEFRMKEGEGQIVAPHEEEARSTGMDTARLKEIYGEDAQAHVDGLVDIQRPPSPPPLRKREHKYHPQRQQQIPLWHLLRNYIYLASRDRRNIVIFILSLLVLLLSLRNGRKTDNISPVQTYTTSSITHTMSAPHHSPSTFTKTEAIPSISSSTMAEPTQAHPSLLETAGDVLTDVAEEVLMGFD